MSHHHKRCAKLAIGLLLAIYTCIVYQSVCAYKFLEDTEFRTWCGLLAVIQTHEHHEGEEESQ